MYFPDETIWSKALFLTCRHVSGLPANRPGPTRAEQQAAERRARRLARYEAVVALRAQGRSRLAIAQEVGLDRRTVSTWLAAGAFPRESLWPPPVRTATEPFAAEIAARYAAGEDNAAAILCQYLRPYHTFTIFTSASIPVP